MIRITFLFGVFLFAAYFLNAQPPGLQWEKSFGGAHLDHAKYMQPTSDSGFVLAGYTRSGDRGISNHGTPEQQDGWILRLDKQGKLLWQRTLGGSADDELTFIKQTADGGYITAGFTQSTDGDVTANHGQADLWVIKLTPEGNIQWQQTYGGTGDEVAYAIEPTGDGGYIAAGYTTSADGDVTINYGQQDYWLLKLTADGVITWQRSFGNTGNNIANSIQQTFDGGYIVAGVSICIPGDSTMSNQHAGTDNWVIKMTSSGNVEWEKAYGGSNADVAKGIIQARDSSYLVIGSTSSADGDVIGIHDAGGLDAWVYCIAPSGTLKWQRALGGSGIDGARTLVQCRDGGFLIGGSTSSNDGDLINNNLSAADYWLVKLNNNGTILWNKTLGSTGEDNAAAALETLDGGYIIAGDASLANKDISVHYGGDDLWVAKLSLDAITYPGSCEQVRMFPNPCNDRLQINLANGWEKATVILNNTMGQTVLINKQSAASRVLDLATPIRGFYLLTLINDNGEKCTTKVLAQ
jgi:hypothetical protein